MYKKRSEIDLFFTWLRLYPFRSLLIGDTLDKIKCANGTKRKYEESKILQ